MAPTHSVIIVGGGLSGCVLAARLTEDPNISVVLIELGSDHKDHPLVPIPGIGFKIWEDLSVTSWFKTTPQNDFKGREIGHPRGKGLGGSTLINYGVIAFPDRHSIDNFELLGNKGWNFETLQPYYRKFHTFHEPSPELTEQLALDYNDPSLHGHSGPIHVSFSKYQRETNLAWGKTLDNLGRKVRHDPISGDAVGGYSAACTADPNGSKRSHAANGYLTPEVRQRSNLKVLTETLVEKVVFKERAGQDSPLVANGVQYISKDGTKQTVNADEVILCGGAFNSPQLLELSGIGAKEILDPLHIKTEVELPGVGSNLQDHTVSGTGWEANIATMDTMVRDANVAGAYVGEYMQQQTGPLTHSTYSIGFFGDEGTDAEKQQLSAILDKHTPGADALPSYRKQYKLLREAAEDPERGSSGYLLIASQPSDEQASPIPPEAKDTDFISFFSITSHPFSRGTVHIGSANINDPPVIDPQYMHHPADAFMAARRLQYAQTIVKTQPLAGLLKPNGLTIPANQSEMLGNIDLAMEHVRTGSTCYHPCGTCAMLPREDGGVVDPLMKVYGTQGLRVIDASVLPLVPRGNIQSTVYAVAERMADLIKEEVKSKN